MLEAIRCRLKVAMWLTLFALPVLATLWHQRIEAQVRDGAYLPALDNQPIIIVVAVATEDNGE